MAWDRTKPAASSPLASADIRSNWDAIARTLAGVNLLADPTFLIWPGGDAVVPAHYTLSGVPTIARAGTGLGDTKRKVGAMCAKLTAGGVAGSIRQNLLPSGAYDDGFDGLVFSAGAWVWASVASAARIGFTDSIGTTYSDYHTGDSTWQWLTVSRTIDATALTVIWLFECAAGQTGYVSGPTVVFGEIPPLYFHPAPILNGQTTCFIAGTQVVGNRKIGCDRYFERPTIIKGCSLAVQTTPVPSGADLIVDLDHWDGAAFQPMYSTSASPAGRPRIVAGVAVGASYDPDATTYRYRCFDAFTTASQTDRLLTVNVDQIGSGNPGVDLYVMIRYMQFARPLEAFLRDTDTN